MPILDWDGKEAVENHAPEGVTFRLLKNNKKESVGNSENLIIEGDNLEALRALMPYYKGVLPRRYVGNFERAVFVRHGKEGMLHDEDIGGHPGVYIALHLEMWLGVFKGACPGSGNGLTKVELTVFLWHPPHIMQGLIAVLYCQLLIYLYSNHARSIAAINLIE